MKLAYLLLAGLAVVLVALPTRAGQPCASGHCPPPAVVTSAPVVAAPIVAATAAVLPLYGAGYTGTGYGTDDETKELLKQLLQEVKQLRQDLASKGGDAPAGDPVGTLSLTAPSVQTVMTKSCASCHTGEKARKGFQLYTDDGKTVRLSGPDRRAVEQLVKAGQMPPPPAKLSPADRDLVLKAIASGK